MHILRFLLLPTLLPVLFVANLGAFQAQSRMQAQVEGERKAEHASLAEDLSWVCSKKIAKNEWIACGSEDEKSGIKAHPLQGKGFSLSPNGKYMLGRFRAQRSSGETVYIGGLFKASQGTVHKLFSPLVTVDIGERICWSPNGQYAVDSYEQVSGVAKNTADYRAERFTSYYLRIWHFDTGEVRQVQLPKKAASIFCDPSSRYITVLYEQGNGFGYDIFDACYTKRIAGKVFESSELNEEEGKLDALKWSPLLSRSYRMRFTVYWRLL
jgi:hypothetical protein